MTRLTDERLRNIDAAPWQDLDDVTNDEIHAMSGELRARRAADLSEEDAKDAKLLLENYRTLRFEQGGNGGMYQWEQHALAVLSKLTGGRDA